MSTNNDMKATGCLVAGIVVALGGIVVTWMTAMPYYWVFHQHQEGKAMLAKSEYAKQVLIQDAMARDQSSKYLAQAEVTRAEGVAKANKIIGESLENNREYLHYLWIHNLENEGNRVIYVATETGMPIFEAGSRFHETAPPRRKSGDPGTPEHPE